jgi:hypothetical protein
MVTWTRPTRVGTVGGGARGQSVNFYKSLTSRIHNLNQPYLLLLTCSTWNRKLGNGIPILATNAFICSILWQGLRAMHAPVRQVV